MWPAVERPLMQRDKLKSFLRYSANSLFCWVLETGAFTLFNVKLFPGLGLEGGIVLTLANTLARVISATVNYSLNRHFAFQSKAPVGRSARRYVILCIGQLAASTALIYVISAITGAEDLWQTVVKICVDGLLYFASYAIQKKWVFADPAE